MTAFQGVSSRSLLRWPVLFFATVGFIGSAPYRVIPFKKWKGGGFLGTLAGVGLLLLFPFNSPLYWIVIFGGLIASIPICGLAEKYLGHHDDPRIVLDEVIGVWIAALALPHTPEVIIAVFVFFRIFDVLKGPWGNAAARLPGGWGIVADDVLAGVLANGCVRLLMLVV